MGSKRIFRENSNILGSMGRLVGFARVMGSHWVVQGVSMHRPFIRNALGGGGSPNVLSAFPPYTLGLGLSYVQIFVGVVAEV